MKDSQAKKQAEESQVSGRSRAKLSAAYVSCIRDLIQTPRVRQMAQYPQHGGLNCLEHCLHVSYQSYRFCRVFGLDSRTAARGGLLHDMFLYDWHKENKSEGPHAFCHPNTALRNAEEVFPLSSKERDIILRHMWPLTFPLPRFRETFVVSLLDKCCAVTEFFRKAPS